MFFMHRRFGGTELYIMKECLVFFPVVFGLPHYSIFKNKFDDLITKMKVSRILLIDKLLLIGWEWFHITLHQETGLITKWYVDELEKVAIIADGEVSEPLEPYSLRFGQNI